MDEALDDGQTNEQPTGQSGKHDPIVGSAEETPTEWKRRIQDLEQELQELVEKNQHLERCVRGVKVVGRALQEAKKEVMLLRGQIKEDNGCDTCMQDGGIGVDNIEDAFQDCSIAMPYIMVPPSKDENTPIGACLEATRERHHDSKNVGENHFEQGVIQDNGKDERVLVQQPTEIKETDKAPEANQTREITNSAEDDTKAKATAEAEQQTEDLAAVEDLTLQRSFPSDTTTPPDITASGVMKSVGASTDGENSFLVKTLAIHRQSELLKQIVELKKINSDWGKFCKQQKSTLMGLLEDRDKKITDLLKELKDAHLDVGRKADQYDEMLLTAKTRIDKLEERNKELQSQLDIERNRNDKSDQLSRNLAKQNQSMAEEIMRLKEALEKRHQQTVRQPQSPAHVVQPIRPLQRVSPEMDKKGDPSPPIEAHQKAPQFPAPSPPAVTQCGAYAPKPLIAPADEMPEATPSKHGLAAPYTPQPLDDVPAAEQEAKGVSDKSYNKEELKEQLELLRQQNQMFQSDFNRENADKVQAMEKLHNLQQELGKKKGRLHGYGHQDLPKERASKFDDVVKSPKSKVKGPEQEAYRPPSENRVKSHRLHGESEQRQTTKDNNGMTVVHMGGKTTCKLTKPTAVIIEPQGERLEINLLEFRGPKQKSSRRRHEMEPFVCPRCQRMYGGNDWESYEHHVTLCNV